MSFRSLEEPESASPHLADAGLLLIRVFAVFAFFYYQLAAQLREAFARFWEGAEWDLVGQLEALHLPAPGLSAALGAGILALALAGVATGLYTRLGAFLALVAVLFLLLSGVVLAPSLTPQALVLYLGIFAGLTAGGGGRLSLDHLLAGRRRREDVG